MDSKNYDVIRLRMPENRLIAYYNLRYTKHEDISEF